MAGKKKPAAEGFVLQPYVTSGSPDADTLHTEMPQAPAPLTSGVDELITAAQGTDDKKKGD